MPDILHILAHAVEDTARMIPFLLAAYALIEYIERRHSQGIERALAQSGRMGFAAAAVLGLVPQCGFSAMAANLYASRVITLGTLLAVFITTSDEAVPILAATPGMWRPMLALLAVKLAVALAAALVVDVALRRVLPAHVRGGYSGSVGDVDCHEHAEADSLLWAALKHTAHITLFIFVFNFAVGFVVEAVGSDVIGRALAAAGYWQPALAALVGLVPNCAASVLITQLFAAGQLSFGGAVAGLCASAGVGLAVLFRANKSLKQNLFVTALLWACGTAAGAVCMALGL